jgi:hypothetical protein
MVEPVEAIRAIHNAFRNDLEHIDAAALDSHGEMSLLPVRVKGLRLFQESRFIVYNNTISNMSVK